ncbi:hypothetical protein LJC55_04540 [Eubacteriales bacterium OttesenSCG-928-N14]|nr:hypothetical protein [Eubacteriales bacterium OttesenSCG-928-N14]
MRKRLLAIVTIVLLVAAIGVVGVFAPQLAQAQVPQQGTAAVAMQSNFVLPYHHNSVEDRNMWQLGVLFALMVAAGYVYVRTTR